MVSADRRVMRGPAATAALGAALVAAISGAPAAAQLEPGYADETARMLHEAAMESRERFDDSLLKYTAVVRQRIRAGLRTPLKDRTVFRMESAHRIFWDRDGENLVQVLGLREQTLAGVDVDMELDDGIFEDSFDPDERPAPVRHRRR